MQQSSEGEYRQEIIKNILTCITHISENNLTVINVQYPSYIVFKDS